MAPRCRRRASPLVALAVVVLVLAACGPSYEGTIHNPCGTEVTVTWQPIRSDGVAGPVTVRVAPALGVVTFGSVARAGWVEVSAPALGWHHTWTNPAAGEHRDFWIDAASCP